MRRQLADSPEPARSPAAARRGRTGRGLLALCASLIGFELGVVVVAVLGRLLGFTPGSWCFAGGLGGSLLGSGILYAARNNLRGSLTAALPAIGASTAATAISAAACALFSAQIIDCSWDGPAYHQEHILQLLKGWNFLDMESPFRGERYLTGWVRSHVHYFPRALSLVSAAFVDLSGHIEAGKAAGLLLSEASFFGVLGSLLSVTGLSWPLALVLAALTVLLSPIQIAELTSFMNDYVMGSLHALLAALLLFLWRRTDRGIVALLVATAALFVNIKLTALLFLPVLIIGCLGAALICRDRRRQAGLGAAVLTLGLAAGLFVGWSPYITKLLAGKNLFVPFHLDEGLSLAGKTSPKNPGIYESMPAALRDKDRFSKFVYSHLGRTWLYDPAYQAEIANPFSFDPLELEALTGIPTTGALGPLFRATLWLTLLAALLSPWATRRAELALTVGCLLAGILAHPENWWARFVPQLWQLPLVIAAFLCVEPRRLLRTAGYLIIGISMANSAQWLVASLPTALEKSREVQTLMEQQAAAGVTLQIDFRPHSAWRRHLAEMGIPFVQEPLSCSEPQSFRGLTQFCELPAATAGSPADHPAD